MVDDQKWEHQILVEDARIHFTFLGAARDLTGITQLIQFIKTAVQDTVSQHALSTQSIELTGPYTAEAMPYVTVIHMGGENHKQKGEMFSAGGKLEDRLTKGIFDGNEGCCITERLVHEHLPNRDSLELFDH